MPQLIDDDYGSADAVTAERLYRAKRRQRMAACLDEVASEVTLALRDAGIQVRVFFSVPSSGEALGSFATADDPPKADWDRVCAIVCEVVGRKLKMEGLRSAPVPCVASGVPMGAADIVPTDDHRPDAKIRH